MTDQTDDTWVTVRLTLPRSLHRELRKLGEDMDLRPGFVLREAALLLLGFHGRGAGLPGPLPRCPPTVYQSDQSDQR